MCRAGSEVRVFKPSTQFRYKRIMSLQRKVVSAAAPPLGVVGDASSSMEGSHEKTMSTRERMETFDKAKMAKILRACLLAKYLRNDNVPSELQQGLYLGSIGAAFNKGLLQNLNVTHILSVVNAVDIPFPHDFKYLRIEVLDSAEVDLAQHFNACFSFIDEARAAGGGVLVHCFAGRSRSVTIVLAYLMRTYGMRLAQALAHVTSRRRVAQPNPGFMRQLQNYDQILEATRRRT
ncbi:unnamed protein product [Calypogeia fissa]